MPHSLVVKRLLVGVLQKCAYDLKQNEAVFKRDTSLQCSEGLIMQLTKSQQPFTCVCFLL